jgi:hypothetical protein
MPTDKSEPDPAPAPSIVTELVASVPGAREPEKPAAAKEPVCPTCGGKLERYAGHAAHKLGTWWCAAEGRRHRL